MPGIIVENKCPLAIAPNDGVVGTGVHGPVGDEVVVVDLHIWAARLGVDAAGESTTCSIKHTGAVGPCRHVIDGVVVDPAGDASKKRDAARLFLAITFEDVVAHGGVGGCAAAVSISNRPGKDQNALPIVIVRPVVLHRAVDGAQIEIITAAVARMSVLQVAQRSHIVIGLVELDGVVLRVPNPVADARIADNAIVVSVIALAEAAIGLGNHNAIPSIVIHGAVQNVDTTNSKVGLA